MINKKKSRLFYEKEENSINNTYFCIIICFFCFLPKEKEKSVKKKIKTISYEHPEYIERYNLYKSKHPHLTKEEIITLVNMNRDYDFYDHIIK